MAWTSTVSIQGLAHTAQQGFLAVGISSLSGELHLSLKRDGHDILNPLVARAWPDRRFPTLR